jgi:hypothetical protein
MAWHALAHQMRSSNTTALRLLRSKFTIILASSISRQAGVFRARNRLNFRNFVYNQEHGRPHWGFIPEDTPAVDTHLATQGKTKSILQPALCFFDLV